MVVAIVGVGARLRVGHDVEELVEEVLQLWLRREETRQMQRAAAMSQRQGVVVRAVVVGCIRSVLLLG